MADRVAQHATRNDLKKGFVMINQSVIDGNKLQSFTMDKLHVTVIEAVPWVSLLLINSSNDECLG